MYYEVGTSELRVFPAPSEVPTNYFRVHRSYGHNTENCQEVENLENRREANTCPKCEPNLRHGDKSPMRGSKKVDPITFIEEDMRGVHYLYYDALVVRAIVARNGLGRIFVDNGSSVNAIFSSTYEQMNIDAQLERSAEPIYGFTGDCVTTKGVIRQAVIMEKEPLATHTFMEFLVVDRRSTYHGVLLGRPALKELWAMTSIHHLCMKFLTERGVATVRRNQLEARKCYRNVLRKAEKKEVNMTILDIEMV
ncbi:Uncharacterized protein Adt_32912 [Abeliophyllum distichum]|uniref:Uncharacterized protein n=1 Tax=Abeliophyllum distichum TaxID=126358 RepID=A0ABD1QUQ3_9LAMI